MWCFWPITVHRETNSGKPQVKIWFVFHFIEHKNCSNVLWRLCGTKLKCNLIKSDFERVREGFFSLSFYFQWSSVVALCCVKRASLWLIKCERLTWVFLGKNSSWGLEGLCDWWARELCMCMCHTNHSVGCIKEQIKLSVRK